MKKIVLTPNPYRDRNFKYVTLADKLLREAGLETRICLAFDVDRSFELPDNVVLTELNHELRDADLLVCFGGDGTILHASKAATKAGIPVLGVNIGTMGFMAELESSELKELRRLADDDFSVEPRMMLHVRAEHEGRVILEEDALNDAVITKGAVARVVQMSVQGDGVDMMSFGGTKNGMMMAESVVVFNKDFVRDFVTLRKQNLQLALEPLVSFRIRKVYDCHARLPHIPLPYRTVRTLQEISAFHALVKHHGFLCNIRINPYTDL